MPKTPPGSASASTASPPRAPPRTRRARRGPCVDPRPPPAGNRPPSSAAPHVLTSSAPRAEVLHHGVELVQLAEVPLVVEVLRRGLKTWTRLDAVDTPWGAAARRVDLLRDAIPAFQVLAAKHLAKRAETKPASSEALQRPKKPSGVGAKRLRLRRFGAKTTANRGVLVDRKGADPDRQVQHVLLMAQLPQLLSEPSISHPFLASKHSSGPKAS